MMKKIVEINDVVWFKNMSIKIIVRLINSKNLSILNDYREIIEKKNFFFKKNKSQDFDITKNDDLKKNSENEKKSEKKNIDYI